MMSPAEERGDGEGGDAIASGTLAFLKMGERGRGGGGYPGAWFLWLVRWCHIFGKILVCKLWQNLAKYLASSVSKRDGNSPESHLKETASCHTCPKCERDRASQWRWEREGD